MTGPRTHGEPPSGQPPTQDSRDLRQRADRLLLRLARQDAWWLALLTCAALVGATAQILLPAAVGRTVDALLGEAAGRHGTGRAVIWWLGTCSLLVALNVISGACVQLASGIATATSTARLRRMLADHVLGCGPGLLRRFTTGDAVSRIVGGTADAGCAPAGAVMAMTAVITPVGSVVALGLIDPWLMVAFAAGFPLLALMLRTFVRNSSNVTADYQRAQGAIAARLLDALGGARTVAAAGTTGRELARILVPLPSLRRYGDRSWRIQARVAAQSVVMVPLLQVAVLGVAGIELARHRLTPGDLLAASQYSALAVGIGASVGQLNRLARGRGGSRRGAELFACQPPRYGIGRLATGPGRLEFRGVTLRLGGEEVLRGLDLTIPGGVAVALVGTSGAGKSVLAGLAGRLLDPDEGEVRLDGADLRSLAHGELRRTVVYAFGRPHLFGRTAGEAIAFGGRRPRRGAVLAAARDACAESFVSRLPAGIDTPLDGTPLSGGEVQRLGLARAFAHAAAARLVILDDATSSLDTVTEMQISRVLTGQLGGRTRLIVAHRVATAAKADLVAWLEDGRLRAFRPHHELWGDARYRAVFGVGPDGGQRAGDPARAGKESAEAALRVP
jgi:ATP-binding cassette subfamily B protein